MVYLGLPLLSSVLFPSSAMETCAHENDDFEPLAADHYPALLLRMHHLVILMALYFLIVFFGPRFMKRRKPFKLKKTMMLYNFLQVIINCYLLYLILKPWGLRFAYAWYNICNPISGTVLQTEEYKYKFMRVLYLYYLNKITDLLDTVFFVLRKKESQISFLHVFHHSTMVVTMYFTLDHIREEVVAVYGILNTIVHILMYSYYLLAAFGPKVHKYIWWKKYLTRVQLIQFVIILSFLAKMRISGCPYKAWFWPIWSFNISVYFIAFVHFYINSYGDKKK